MCTVHPNHFFPSTAMTKQEIVDDGGKSVEDHIIWNLLSFTFDLLVIHTIPLRKFLLSIVVLECVCEINNHLERMFLFCDFLTHIGWGELFIILQIILLRGALWSTVEWLVQWCLE